MSEARLMMGDCMELMREISDKSVDMVLCDLPYGTTQNKWDCQIPFDSLWSEYRRILAEDGVIALTASQPFTSITVCSNPEWFRYDIIWEKSKATGFLNAKRRPLRAHEEILIFSPKAPRYNPQMVEGRAYDKGRRKAQSEDDSYGRYGQVVVSSDGSRYPRSVIYYATAESEGKTFHKTQKPVALMEYLIRTYTKEGETVLDNTMGSGTTGVACLKSGRKFIGIERDEEYFEIATRRIEAARTLQDMSA